MPSPFHRLPLLRRSCLALAGLFGWIAVAGYGRADRPPNIVFILVDDVSWSDWGCYGNEVHDTPNIDRLAQQGTRFTQAYAPAPICSASRAAILTGKLPARLGFEFVTKSDTGDQPVPAPLRAPPYTLDLPLAERTMAESLGSAGYATGFFGKWHVSRHHQGYLGWSPTHGPAQQGFGEGSSDFGSHPYGYRADRGLRSRTTEEGEFPRDSLTSKATEFIRRHRDEPFFLYLSHYYAHDPVHSRCEWLVDKYRQRLSGEGPPSRASYAAMIETLDHLIGRLLQALRTAGVEDETMVVLMSDNGGHPNHTSNAPLRGSKWNLYEGGIRVPLIIRWPGHSVAGSQCDFLVHGCDLYPTFCDVAQVGELPDRVDGVSLVPLLREPRAGIHRRQPLVWHFPYYHPERKFADAPAQIGVADFVTSQTRPQSSIRVGDWKLIRFYEHDRDELYHLPSDLAEQTNLAGRQSRRAAELRERLDAELRGMGARFPRPR